MTFKDYMKEKAQSRFEVGYIVMLAFTLGVIVGVLAK